MRNRTVTAVVCGVVGAAFVSVLAQGGGLAQSVQPIFDRECTKCHGAKEQKSKLDLSADKAYASLVNAPSKEAPSMMRVKPGDPESSYLWLKLQHKAPEGSGMPKGLFSAKHLSAADLDVIKAWIADGAKP